MARTIDSNPVYLILGAAGGIGSVLSRQLASQGAHVVLAGRTRETIEATASSLGAESVVVDATDGAALEACVEEVITRHDYLDGIANCFGSLLLKPAHLTTDREWDETLTSNLRTAFNTLRAGARAMLKTGKSIVLVASAAANVGLPNHEAIAAAKAGIVGLVRSAGATYASRGIRVNCVAPGLVETPLSHRFTATSAAQNVSRAMHPLGRIGRPSDVGAAIAWLLDPINDWVTGQVFNIDGGLSTMRTPNKPQANTRVQGRH